MTSSRDVLIQTDAMDAAVSFYERILGFRVFQRTDQMVGLETGAFRLFLDKGTPYGPVFELYVQDLEAAKSQLMIEGCRIEVEDPHTPRCYMRDPYGLIFNVAEQTSEGERSHR